MTVMRELTYRIPLQPMTRAASCEAMIAKEALKANASCYVNYESRHSLEGTLSTMVLTLYVSVTQSDPIHVRMKKVIAAALAIYSPETEAIQVSDKGVMIRSFTEEDVSNA